jgi:hypothetical protein
LNLIRLSNIKDIDELEMYRYWPTKTAHKIGNCCPTL